MADEIRFFELNTGAKIPSVGLGTWQADPAIVGNGVEAAVKIGYRHIDCSQIYGNEKEGTFVRGMSFVHVIRMLKNFGTVSYETHHWM